MARKTDQPRQRTPISIPIQTEVFFRDYWICAYCNAPTVFAPALKYMQRYITDAGYPISPAYYELHYRRDKAPLLDQSAAVVDHIEAFSKNGAHDPTNFVTACNKCNLRKNAKEKDLFLQTSPKRVIQGRYGEPIAWDGFASFFVVYGRQHPEQLSTQERKWLMAFEKRLKSNNSEGQR